MSKKIMITGAAGFLGSHLMLHHLDRGDLVLGLDNFCSSERDSGHVKRINAAAHNSKSTLVECDISSHPQLISATSFSTAWKGKFDLIYNFACPASPPKYQALPVETMMTCTLGMKNVLDLARRDGAVVVQASTSEVYGDPLVSPQSEDYRGCVNSYGPRSCYDEGKRAAEALCYDYLRKYGVDARLVRIFNTYGPHMDPTDGRVVSNFICQALRGEYLTVYGDGKQTRSFCYVDDLIRAIVAMGELSGNPGSPINIGNPNEFTMARLATEVVHGVYGGREDHRGAMRWLKFEKLPIDDPMQRCPSITLAKSILGWQPEVELKDGLKLTIDYFREKLNVPSVSVV